MIRLAVSLLAALAAAIPARAASPPDGVGISDAWFARTGAHSAIGFFTITNTQDAPLLITGFRSPACRSLQMQEAGSGTRSQGLRTLTVAGKNTMAFVRGGYHLMCIEPTTAIQPGGSVAVTTTFHSGHAITTQFPVRDDRKGA